MGPAAGLLLAPSLPRHLPREWSYFLSHPPHAGTLWWKTSCTIYLVGLLARECLRREIHHPGSLYIAHTIFEKLTKGRSVKKAKSLLSSTLRVSELSKFQPVASAPLPW